MLGFEALENVGRDETKQEVANPAHERQSIAPFHQQEGQACDRGKDSKRVKPGERPETQAVANERLGIEEVSCRHKGDHQPEPADPSGK